MTNWESMARTARRVFATAGLFLVAAALAAETALPPPQMEGGKPLMQALKERRSARSFATTPLAPQTLSNLLWAAFGVNRPATGGRTAPSAHDQQEIELHAVLPDGAYRYDARAHRLVRTVDEDLRPLAGTQAFVRAAPLTLIYVADERRMTPRDDEATRRFYAAADSGFIAQNVYLFCASEGLATVVFAAIDRERLARAMRLGAHQRIVLAQSVGYPPP